MYDVETDNSEEQKDKLVVIVAAVQKYKGELVRVARTVALKLWLKTPVLFMKDRNGIVQIGALKQHLDAAIRLKRLLFWWICGPKRLSILQLQTRWSPS